MLISILKGDYDVDPKKISESRGLRVEITDKEGEVAQADIKLTIYDINDNPPVFNAVIFQKLISKAIL